MRWKKLTNYMMTDCSHDVCVCVCVCVCGVFSRFSHVQLCGPMDCSPPDSSIHGILQARILEWVAISFPQGAMT